MLQVIILRRSKLNSEVRYNGINNVYNVPVKVYEYQYKFKKSEYSTIVGTSFEGNGNINNYIVLENANGLPTDGFHLVWTQNTTLLITNNGQI